MDFDELLQKAIDKQRVENGLVMPEYVFIYDTPFSKTDRKLGEFNFKIEFNKEHDEIQLRLWRKE